MVEIQADELAALWRAFPSAVARDSSGPLNDGHGAGGSASKGSPATVNLGVVDAAARIESGLLELAAQAVRLLNLTPDAARRPLQIIEALPNWHVTLANKRQPLAEHMRKDLTRWVTDARLALGTQRRDAALGPLCPDHRDTRPTPLLKVGAVADLAPSLLAGPPRARLHISRTGPACADCSHVTCVVIRDSRVVDAAGNVTDWVLTSEGMAWIALDGGPAFRWAESNAIRCPHCKLWWKSTSERRLLARRLAELGDARSDDLAALVL